MKRNYVAIVAVAALALTSCVQEVPENGKEEIVISENALAFSIQGTAKTRSVEADEPLSVTHLRLGAPIDGEQYYLEETLTLLDGVPAETPATRGTPAYTSNIASLYGAFNAVGYATSETFAGKDGSDAPVKDVPFDYNGNVWQHEFSTNPLDVNPELYLFMRMPAEQPGVEAPKENSPKYTYDFDATKKEGKIQFSYASPATAKAQKDILFAGRPVTKADFAPVAPVLFHHALTGVKFATANHQSGKDGGTKTVITKIEFVGLKTTGTCTVTPTSENEVYKDDPKTYSSATAVQWSDRNVVEGQTISETFTFENNYGSNIYSSHYDYENGGANDNYFPDSFYAEDKAVEAQTGIKTSARRIGTSTIRTPASLSGLSRRNLPATSNCVLPSIFKPVPANVIRSPANSTSASS